MREHSTTDAARDGLSSASTSVKSLSFKCRRQQLREGHAPQCGADYIPSALAKVKKTWFTRQDADGNMVLVQVEEGILDGDVARSGVAASPAPAPAHQGSRFARKKVSQQDAFNSALSTGSDNPFHELLRESKNYIHPQSQFVSGWEHLVLMPVCAYLTMLVPFRLAFPRCWPTPLLVVVDAICSLVIFMDVVLRFFGT